MSGELIVRAATVEDAGTLARHRAEMFRDMGEVPPETYDALIAASRAFFEQSVTAGTYRGWLAADPATQAVVAGVGLVLRELVAWARAQGFGRLTLHSVRHGARLVRAAGIPGDQRDAAHARPRRRRWDGVRRAFGVTRLTSSSRL